MSNARAKLAAILKSHGLKYDTLRSVEGAGVSDAQTMDFFNGLLTDKRYINFLSIEKKQKVLEYFRILSALGQDTNKTHPKLVALLPPNEQRIEMEQVVLVQQQAFAEAQARARREAEAQAEAQRQREARAEAQRQEDQRRANAALQAQLNANNAQKTPRTRKRNHNKANRNVRNLLASPNIGSINEQIIRGRKIRKADVSSRNQVLQNFRDHAEYLTYQLISAIPNSTDKEGLKEIYRKHIDPFLKIYHTMNLVNRQIGEIRGKKKKSEAEKHNEIEKKNVILKRLNDMLHKENSMLQLIEKRIRELIPSIKTHANFIREMAVPEGAAAALENAAPAEPAAAAAAAATAPAAPATAPAAAPEYGPQGLKAPGGRLQDEDEPAVNAGQAPAVNAGQAPPVNGALEEAEARVKAANQAVAQEAIQQEGLVQRVNRLHEALIMPNPAEEQAEKEVKLLMAKAAAPTGGRKRTRKHKRSKTRRN